MLITITSDLVDQGAFGKWTLMMHVVQLLRIYPGMRIGQMTFWTVSGKPLLYNGKYANSGKPTASKSWTDFSQNT